MPAQRWGMNYACDLPFETFEVLLDHVSKTHTDVSFTHGFLRFYRRGEAGKSENQKLWSHLNQNRVRASKIEFLE